MAWVRQESQQTKCFPWFLELCRVSDCQQNNSSKPACCQRAISRWLFSCSCSYEPPSWSLQSLHLERSLPRYPDISSRRLSSTECDRPSWTRKSNRKPINIQIDKLILSIPKPFKSWAPCLPYSEFNKRQQSSNLGHSQVHREAERSLMQSKEIPWLWSQKHSLQTSQRRRNWPLWLSW